jgi:hypothetical protein
MSARGLMIGALGVGVFIAMSVASDTAFAARKAAKKGGQVGTCVIVPPPICLPFSYPVCLKNNPCGGCMTWTCRPWWPPPARQ